MHFQFSSKGSSWLFCVHAPALAAEFIESQIILEFEKTPEGRLV